MIFIAETILFIISAPLLSGFVKWAKCQLQNRRSPSLFQPYRDLNKLLHKETVVAQSASRIFYLAPYVVFSTAILSSSIIPLLFNGSSHIIIADVIVLVGLFALARFFLTLAGMDIGTAFGGMGSSREMLLASLAEPALLMAFFTLANISSSTNLNVIMSFIQHQFLLQPSLIFVACGFALVAIAETGRIPINNPATHLELTMIHEAMLLEYSGRHLALMEWAQQIKFMIYCVLFVNLFFPWGMAHDLSWNTLLLSFFALIFKLVILTMVLAIAETNLAKLRLFRAPYLLNLAFLLCLLGVLNHIILEVG